MNYSDNSQECENPRKKICFSKAASTTEQSCRTGNSTSDKACQTEEPWDTIIVNQIPENVHYEKLISLFLQYGSIKSTYLCNRNLLPNAIRFKMERIARIRFDNEGDAFKVWEASQKKLIKYDDHVLMITLASDDYSPIQNLPDICLREIFRRFHSIQDKFNVELVCKRWRNNGRCTWSSITRIDSCSWDIKTWRVILSRVSNSLENLDLFLSNNADEEFLQAVASEHCVNLKKLDCLFFGGDCTLFRSQIKRIIEQSKNLCGIRLESLPRVKNFDMDLIDFLPVGLMEIDVDYCGAESISLTTVLSRFQNLQVLKLQGVVMDDHQLIDDVVSLETLSLIRCDIPNSVFVKILRNNKGLKYLDIDFVSGGISDDSVMCMQRLPALEVLMIGGDEFTNAQMSAIGEIMSLKDFSCSSCSLITDEGVQNFFNSISNITKLSIYKCPITLLSIVIAQQWTERTGKSLKLAVDRDLLYEYSQSPLENTEKFQVIEFEDY